MADPTPQQEQAITRVLHALTAELHESLCNCRKYPDKCASKDDYRRDALVDTFSRAELEEAIRQGWTPPPPAGSDAPAHVHTDACMCDMGSMDIPGAMECSHCGGHAGGPCGSLCEVAHDEIVKGADPAPRVWQERDEEPEEIGLQLSPAPAVWTYTGAVPRWPWQCGEKYADWHVLSTLAPLSEVPAPTGTEHR